MEWSNIAVSGRSADFIEANPGSDSISPLPRDFREGLMAVCVFSALSFILSSTFWLYLTYKLITWRLRVRARARRLARNMPEPSVIPDLNFDENTAAAAAHERNIQQLREAKSEAPNQFLVLIYNLFLADMHQSGAFVQSASWLRKDGIFIHQPTCFIQGYLDSNGDLASSCFISFIAVHTYLSIVRGYQPPAKLLNISIILIWVLVYSLSSIPLIVTKNGRDVGGFFVRAGAWCWISSAYNELRITTHYVFIFLSLIVTSVVYIAIFFHLRSRSKRDDMTANVRLSRKPAFLVYVVIYVACTLPLAVARVTAMAGKDVPITYYCIAGSMMAANGFFDCVIFGMTRRSIVFGSTQDVDSKSTGLETFSFVRTPAGTFGHEVLIQGGFGRSRGDLSGDGASRWWPSLGRGNSKGSSTHAHQRSLSQESLRGGSLRGPSLRGVDLRDDMAIHMDVVTSMTVEKRRTQPARYPEQSSSEAPSVQSVNSPSERGMGLAL